MKRRLPSGPLSYTDRVSRLLDFLNIANTTLDKRFGRFVQQRRKTGRLVIVAFCGYGTPTHATLRGRVLRPRTLTEATERDPRWRNALNVARRFLSREVHGVAVHGTLAGVRATATTDQEGYFDLTFAFDAPLSGEWHEAALTLGSPDSAVTAPVHVVQSAAFGVISDLDDTVVESKVTRRWRMLTTVMLGNARTRLPFPGVSALYRALVGGPSGSASNPVFYVSSSPWNLFDMLWAFLEYRHIPLGPIFLRDWSLSTLHPVHGDHKLEAIARIVGMYPTLKFVLVGDSGEQDPEIYREVVRAHPDRVLAVYIREVTGARRRSEVMALRHELRAANVDLVLATDSLAAAHHAYALGLIPASSVREVGESASR